MNKDSPTKETLFEVLHVSRFPLPEKRGEVVCFENDLVALDALADTRINLSVFEQYRMVNGDHEMSSQLCEGGQSSLPQMLSPNPLRDFDGGMM